MIFFRLKLCFIKMIFFKKLILLDFEKAKSYTMWISTLLSHYSNHNNQMIKFYSFKLTTSFSFGSRDFKILNLLVSKCHRDSYKNVISWQKIIIFKISLKVSKKLQDKLSVKYQKLVRTYSAYWGHGFFFFLEQNFWKEDICLAFTR